MAAKCREMDNNRDIYCYTNQWVVNFEGEYQSLPPGIKILVMPQVSYLQDEFLGTNGKTQFSGHNLTFF